MPEQRFNLSDSKAYVLNFSSILNNPKILAGIITLGFWSTWELFDDTTWENIT